MNTNTPASVEGCTSCGALYEAAPGDRGVCAACRRLLPSDPPWRAPTSPTLAGTSPSPASPKPVGAFSKRPGASSAQRPNFARGRGLRRFAIFVVCALLAGGVTASLTMRGHGLSDAWTAIRRHSAADAWTILRRHASDAWIAVRRYTPFDEPHAKRSASAPPATPSHASLRDATAARGTHRHAQVPVGTGKAKAKRSRDDMSTAGNTP